MIRAFRPLLALLAFLWLFAPSLQGQETKPRNIIFLIGDGMGAGQVTAMKMHLGNIALDAFPVGGMVLTQSIDGLVTESAAAGTAFSTGERTMRRKVSVRPDGVPLPRLFSAAQAKGKAVGTVSTSSVTHATPATFLTHSEDRDRAFDIAEGIRTSDADVLIGGGRRYFLPQSAGGGRTDGRDLAGEMREQGYTVLTDTAAAPPRHGRLLWLLGDDGLPPASKRALTLRALAETAIALLSQDEDGFVLMIEGSQIDWAAHDNDFDALLEELRDFDGAIAAAVDFARRDGETLVVVTADHETGGLAVSGTDPEGSDMRGHWISDDHSGNMVPLFAFGPAAARFGGLHRNDEVGRLLRSLLQ